MKVREQARLYGHPGAELERHADWIGHVQRATLMRLLHSGWLESLRLEMRGETFQLLVGEHPKSHPGATGGR